MSVEQTTQLIQLILNSVLLMAACVLALGRFGNRQTIVEEQLKSANRRYADLLEAIDEADSFSKISSQSRLFQVKKALRQLRQRYVMTHYSLLATYYAFLFSAISTFTVTLRTLINADWLIVVALGLFIVSVAGLLLGVGLAVVDLHASKLPLWQEVGGMANQSRSPASAKSGSRPRALRGTSKTFRRTTPELRPYVKARVG